MQSTRLPGRLALFIERDRPSARALSLCSLLLSSSSSSLFSVCRRALSLFREMEAKGIERSTVTYTGLINACAEGGQLDKAMALFTYMEVAGVERNPVTYCVAINGCTRNGQWEVCAARTGTPSPLRFSFLSHHPSLAPFFFIFPSQTARPPAITRDGAQRHPPRHPSIQRGDLGVREG